MVFKFHYNFYQRTLEFLEHAKKSVMRNFLPKKPPEPLHWV